MHEMVDYKLTSVLDLLETILYEKVFDDLRTKQQLGYYVGAAHRLTRSIHGFSFTV